MSGSLRDELEKEGDEFERRVGKRVPMLRQVLEIAADAHERIAGRMRSPTQHARQFTRFQQIKWMRRQMRRAWFRAAVRA